MKTKRAKDLFSLTPYNENTSPAIAALVNFAAQNPGLDFANYGERASYDAEARGISADWQRFKTALLDAAAVGVTDADVIAQAPHAFSGRLEWGAKQHTPASVEAGQASQEGGWTYTTGQYWPTEYRKAAATLLEYAARNVRQARPKATRTVVTIAALKRLNEENGGCWFEPATMRFFKTRIESGIMGHYFVSSEEGPSGGRRYTVRSFSETGDVGTEGEFQGYGTKHRAIETARELARQPEPVTA